MKAEANKSGVFWTVSKSGKLDVAVAPNPAHLGGGWQVWAIYHGTHDVAPRSKRFTTARNGKSPEQQAREYGNSLWRDA